MSQPRKITVATAWLDGCSGCHMSFLDIDERLMHWPRRSSSSIARWWTPRQLPESVDVGILEGAVSTEEDLDKAQEFRKHCKFLISLGDCAVSGNVPAMRNFFPLEAVLDRAYKENVQMHPQRPERRRAAAAVDPVRPLHGVVHGRPVRAGLPAVGRHDLARAERTDRRPRCPKPTEITRFGA